MNKFDFLFFRCSESPGPGYEKCSCSDCRDSCSVHAFTPVFESFSEPFTIFEFDGPSFTAVIVFSFFFIIASLCYCFCRKSQEPRKLEFYVHYFFIKFVGNA